MDFTKLNSLIAVQHHFNSDSVCREYLESILWNGTPVCPHCGNIGQAYKLKDGKTYKCKEKLCAKKFTVTVGTIFDNTKIPLPKWFAAMYLVTSHKKGISSCQLAKDIEITQKSAWFVLGRIREMLKIEIDIQVTSLVEIDETYVGGKAKNKHKVERKELLKNGTGGANKSMVFGILERGGSVQTFIVKNPNGETLKPLIRDMVEKGATIVTDSHGAYTGLNADYIHEIVNHTKDEYVRGQFHTNSIEGFWSQLKRGLFGIYHHCSPQHLHRYCHEFSFRYNTRKATEGERFGYALTQSGKRLTYEDYIGKD